MDGSEITELVQYAVVIGGTALAYSKAFGSAQAYVVEAIIQAASVPKRRKPAVNILVGLMLGLIFSVPVGAKTGQWWLLLAGALAGFLASVEAAKAHDAADQAAKVDKSGMPDYQEE